MRSRTARRMLALCILGAGVALVLAVLLERGGGGELTLTAAGKTVRLRPGTTLGQAASELALQPRAGNLLDDDGPSPQYTPRIVATLRRLHVHATFFAIGYLADEYPDLIRRELRAGMTVANHSYNHPEVPPFDQLPARLRADEIALGAQSLRRVGAEPKLFRPPGGSFSPAVSRTADRLREQVLLLSGHPRAWPPGVPPRP